MFILRPGASQPPITVELTAEAVLNRNQIAQLNNISCLDSGHDINIILKQPCSDFMALEFYFKGMKLNSQQVSTNVNTQFSTVNFTWQGTIGNLNSSGTNLFVKANAGNEYYVLTSTSIITGVDSFGDLYFTEQQNYERRIVENMFFSGSYV